MLRHVSAVALGLLLTLPAAADEPLRWKFAPEQTFYTEEAVELQQTVTAKGQPHRHAPSRTTVLGFRVTEILPDDAVRLEVTIEAMTATGDGGSPEFFERLRGATFQVTLDRDRRIVKFDGYDDFIKRAAGGDDQQARVYRQILPAETLKASIGQLFTLLPGKDVPRGETWTQTVTVSLGPLGGLALTRTLTNEGSDTLDGQEAVKLPFTATARYQPAADTAGTLPFKIIKTDLNFKDISGTAWYDPQAGRLLRLDSQMTLDGTLTLQTGADQQDMKLEQHQTMRLRVLDMKPAAPGP